MLLPLLSNNILNGLVVTRQAVFILQPAIPNIPPATVVANDFLVIPPIVNSRLFSTSSLVITVLPSLSTTAPVMSLKQVIGLPVSLSR